MDVLQTIDLYDAGDVFIRCNRWGECGVLFVASGIGSDWHRLEVARCQPASPFERGGYVIGGHYAVLHAEAAKERAEQLVTFRASPWDRVMVPTPSQQRDMHSS